MNGEKQFEKPSIKKRESEEGKPLSEILIERARLNAGHAGFRIEDYYEDLIKYNDELSKNTNEKKKKEFKEKIEEIEKKIHKLEKEISTVNKELADISSDELALEYKLIQYRRKDLDTIIRERKSELKEKQIMEIKQEDKSLLLQRQTIRLELKERGEVLKIEEK